MSELTKEKIYKKELEKVGGEGNNNLERIRSLSGGSGGALYKHTVTLTCLNDCSNTEDVIVIFNSSKEDAYTEEEFKDFFSIYWSANDYYLLDIVNVVIDTYFNNQSSADVLMYNKNNDAFSIRGQSLTLQSFEDVVTTI